MSIQHIKSPLGYCGKIPSKGDFIQNDVNLEFFDRWNEWIDSVIFTSQEQLAEKWLEYYLTSPIWHFSLSSGVCCQNAIFGSIIPSIDKINRSFPFTIVTSHEATAVQAWSNNTWDVIFEELILEVLEDDFDLSQWDKKLKMSPELFDSIISFNNNVTRNKSNKAMVILGLQNNKIEALLDQQYQLQFSQYSLWWTRGSDFVEPCFIVTEGLPPVNQFSSMLNGDWQKRNWNISKNI